MFTGIVEGKVEIVDVTSSSAGMRLGLDLGGLAEGVSIGDSIAVDGCCLTVVALEEGCTGFDAVPETLDRTQLQDRRAGDRVNVERAMRFGDRLGGHLVTGHVDGVGKINQIRRRGDQIDFEVAVPALLSPFLIEKGSITLDGISLTLASVGDEHFRVAVIPHTLQVTTLADRKVGDRVNLEGDVLGKWVARLMRGRVEGTFDLGDVTSTP